MSSSIHFKFKSSREFDVVNFDGPYISVGELKRSIIAQKKLEKAIDFDLLLTNAQTGDEYAQEAFLIPRNTAIVVKRVPVTPAPQLLHGGPASRAVPTEAARPVIAVSSFDAIKKSTPKPVSAASEEATIPTGDEQTAISGMIAEAQAEWTVAEKGPGRRRTVHPSIKVCYKCGQGGHYTHECPHFPPGTEPPARQRKPTGIPRSMLRTVTGDATEGAMQLEDGSYVVVQPNDVIFQHRTQGTRLVGTMGVAAPVPDELKCPICEDLFTDAVFVPCCKTVYCDECIRTALLEDSFSCPNCHVPGISPDSLLPSDEHRVRIAEYLQKKVDKPVSNTSSPTPTTTPPPISTTPPTTTTISTTISTTTTTAPPTTTTTAPPTTAATITSTTTKNSTKPIPSLHDDRGNPLPFVPTPFGLVPNPHIAAMLLAKARSGDRSRESGDEKRERRRDRSREKSRERSGERRRYRSRDRSGERRRERSGERRRDRSRERSGERRDRSREEKSGESGDESRERRRDRSRDEKSGDEKRERRRERRRDTSRERSGERRRDRSREEKKSGDEKRERRRDRSRDEKSGDEKRERRRERRSREKKRERRRDRSREEKRERRRDRSREEKRRSRDDSRERKRRREDV